jgi:hypothetical protein
MLQVVTSIHIPAVSPSVARALLPIIEMKIRKLIQQANKFQRRGKRKSLTGFTVLTEHKFLL